jgi:hypothetical protein
MSGKLIRAPITLDARHQAMLATLVAQHRDARQACREGHVSRLSRVAAESGVGSLAVGRAFHDGLRASGETTSELVEARARLDALVEQDRRHDPERDGAAETINAAIEAIAAGDEATAKRLLAETGHVLRDLEGSGEQRSARRAYREHVAGTCVHAIQDVMPAAAPPVTLADGTVRSVVRTPGGGRLTIDVISTAGGDAIEIDPGDARITDIMTPDGVETGCSAEWAVAQQMARRFEAGGVELGDLQRDDAAPARGSRRSRRRSAGARSHRASGS